MREERICILSKSVWTEMLQAMPPESRLLTYNWPELNAEKKEEPAIVLHSPFGYRLLFVKEQ